MNLKFVKICNANQYIEIRYEIQNKSLAEQHNNVMAFVLCAHNLICYELKLGNCIWVSYGHHKWEPVKFCHKLKMNRNWNFLYYKNIGHWTWLRLSSGQPQKYVNRFNNIITISSIAIYNDEFNLKHTTNFNVLRESLRV